MPSRSDECRIFINYRRSDTGGYAFALHRDLCRRFDEIGIFFDRASIESGDVFPERLRLGVENCAVLLALIGPGWLDARKEDGTRRLDDESDYVRKEIALALALGKRVIPLLFDDTPLPTADRLPDALKALPLRDALMLRGKLYEYDAQFEELVRLLAQVPGVPERRQELSRDLLRKSRTKLLEKTRRDWIEAVLEPNLEEFAPMELTLTDTPSATEQPLEWVQKDRRRPQSLPTSNEIAAIFEKMDRAILILGEAGAGKTTLMLQLTQELLKVAESDEDQPFPVVCYLSPWPTSQPRGGRAGRERPVEQQPSLQEWIISQLKDEYKVPPRVASSWLETRSLVLLFDGLNEVVEPYRKQCVDSINEFVSEYDSTPVVVLCRSEDYATLAVRLDLHAVTIDPLSRELVSRYLRDGGPPLSGVYTALKEDEDLWELIETPLFFNIFLKTFRGVTASEIKLKGDIPDRRKQLFDKYIQRMLHDHLRAKESNYHASQTVWWLSWIAKSLRQYQFKLEGMQPQWLPRYQEITLNVGAVILTAEFFCLGLASIDVWTGARMFGTSTWLGWGLAAGLFVGMVGSLGQGLFAFARYIRPVNSLEVSFSNLTDVVVGLTDGLLLGLTFGLLSSGVFGVVLGSVAGIGRIIEYGLFVGLVTGVFAGLALARREKLTASKGPPREIVRVVLTLALLLGAMTWYFAAPGGAQGALSALAFEGSTRFALAVALGLLTGTAGWVLLRTTAEEAEKEVSDDEGDGRAARGGEGRFSTPRVRPSMNQGIRRSLRHAGLTMLVIGGLAGLIVGAAFDCKIGIGVGFVVGIGFAFVNGGHACLQHFGLRLLIWANDFGPLNYAPFLEHCRTLTFLRRKLTGYTFFHPLFKEHLAKIENLSVFKVPNSPR